MNESLDPAPRLTAIRGRARELGERWTAASERIVAVLAAADGYPNAVELAERVRASDPSIGLSTVYRTLARFADAGLVRRIPVTGRHARYELADGATRHHLVVATEDAIDRIDDAAFDAALTALLARRGLRLIGGGLDLQVARDP